MRNFFIIVGLVALVIAVLYGLYGCSSSHSHGLALRCEDADDHSGKDRDDREPCAMPTPSPTPIRK